MGPDPRRARPASCATSGHGGTSTGTARRPRPRRPSRRCCRLGRPLGARRADPRLPSGRRRGRGHAAPPGRLRLRARPRATASSTARAPRATSAASAIRCSTRCSRAGCIRPDPLGLGVETAADGALLDASGTPVARPLSRRSAAEGRLLGGHRRAGAAPARRAPGRAAPALDRLPDRSRSSALGRRALPSRRRRAPQ